MAAETMARDPELRWETWRLAALLALVLQIAGFASIPDDVAAPLAAIARECGATTGSHSQSGGKTHHLPAPDRRLAQAAFASLTLVAAPATPVFPPPPAGGLIGRDVAGFSARAPPASFVASAWPRGPPTLS